MNKKLLTEILASAQMRIIRHLLGNRDDEALFAPNGQDLKEHERYKANKTLLIALSALAVWGGFMYYLYTAGNGSYQPVPMPEHIRQELLQKQSAPGGIDLEAAKDLMKSTGYRIFLKVDPFQLRQLQNSTGVKPVIMDITPVTDLRLFLD